MSTGSGDPLFTIGLIADAQYADLDNGDTEGRCQRYREVPAKLRAALTHMAHAHPTLLIHLGDLINGNPAGRETTIKELDLVAGIIEESGLPTRHVLGNHDLAVGRTHALAQLHVPAPGYYTEPLHPGWRLVVLDTTEMSGHAGVEPDTAAYREARAYEMAHPLSEADPQMQPWNGGATSSQVAWLKAQLDEAEVVGERVIVACHHQVGAGAARASHMAWNWRQLEAALVGSTAFSVALAGHDHLGRVSIRYLVIRERCFNTKFDDPLPFMHVDTVGAGGYAVVDGFKHFITLEALLEAPTNSNAYALAHVYDDRIQIQGFGTVTSRQIDLS